MMEGLLSPPLLPAALPLYKPEKVQVAQLGKPFDFNFGYSSPNQPSSFSWTKNDLPFRNSGHRVCVDYTGIIFTRVLHSDAGTYVVTANNTAGTTSASAVLEGRQLYVMMTF